MDDRHIGTASLVRLLGAWRGGSGQAAYRALADALKLLILDGRLPLNARLPGERELARALELSRTTVAAAFEALRGEGFLASRRGSGSRTVIPAGPGARAESFFTGEGAPGLINLAAAAFPAGPAVHGAYAAALAALPAYLPGNGYEPIGLPVLRQRIADRYSARGIATAPDQIMVTSGAQHGLALLLRAFAVPGDRVVIDHPTYPHAIDAIHSASCRAVPVGLPASGWDIEGLAAAFRQTGPRLAYLIPDFHNPTGRFMSDAERQAVIAAAAERTLLVFDETLADLWFEAPMTSAIDGRGVVRLGSMGKSHWGGLRFGWVRAEPDVVARLAAVRPTLDLGTPVLEQLAAAALLATGEGLDERRGELRSRRDFLIRRVAERLPGWRVAAPPGGLALWAELPGAFSSALAATSERFGVRLSAGPRFGVRGAFERYLRLPFALPEDQLAEAVDRLAGAAAALGHSRPEAEAPAQRQPELAMV